MHAQEPAGSIANAIDRGMPGWGKPFGALELLESVMRETSTAGDSGYLTQSEGLVVKFND